MNHILSNPNEIKIGQGAGNPLNASFDTFKSNGDGLTPAGAAYVLNRTQRAVQGIGGITRLLIASGAAEEADQLSAYLTGALLIAANTLAEYVESDIEKMAKRANDCTGEARHV